MFLGILLNKRSFLFLILSIVFFKMHAQTTIGDSTIIDLAVFSKAGSPYTLTGTIDISYRGTLIVEPGVEILISSTAQKISVEGKLQMLGTQSDSIYIRTEQTSSKSDFYLERVSTSPNDTFKLSYLVVENFNNIYRSFSVNPDTISNSRIFNCDIGIGGIISTVNCRIYSCRIGIQNNNALVENSSISNCSEAAFESIQDFDIRQTTLSDSPTGLKDGVINSGNSMFRNFVGNVVKGNTVGVELYSSVGKQYYQFSDNIITENDTGLVVYSSENIISDNNNKICNNSLYNIYYTVKYNTFNATKVCWCTNDSAEIQSTIYDVNQSYDLGLVDFSEYIRGCSIDTGTVLGIQPVATNLKAEIYPNPFLDQLYLNGYKGSVRVSNLAGQIQFEGNIEDNINTSSWKSGLYFIKTEDKIYKLYKR